MGGKTAGVNPETDTLPIEPESLAGAQEGVPVPLWWGKNKIALRWIIAPTNQLAVENNDRAGKK